MLRALVQETDPQAAPLGHHQLAEPQGFARRRMMAMIKVLLPKHKYPPDKQAEATGKVIALAQLLADMWADKGDSPMAIRRGNQVQ